MHPEPLPRSWRRSSRSRLLRVCPRRHRAANRGENGPCVVPHAAALQPPRLSQSRVVERAPDRAGECSGVCRVTGAGEAASQACSHVCVCRCPRAGWVFPRRWAGRGGGARGQGVPLHLAGLVMMRAEKSKRFLLIFRRVLTSSSSSLTWIVRCSWSPTRFCHRKTQQKSVRHVALTSGEWRLVLPPTAANPKPFRPLPPPSPTQTAAPPVYTINKFEGSFLPVSNLRRALRTGSAEERTPQGVRTRRTRFPHLGAALTFSLVEYICAYIFSAFSK